MHCCSCIPVVEKVHCTVLPDVCLLLLQARLRHEETELAVEAAQVQAAEMDMQRAMLEAEMSSQHRAAQTALRSQWTQHEVNQLSAGKLIVCIRLEYFHFGEIGKSDFLTVYRFI